MAAVLSFILRVLIGGIFLASGLAKIADPVRFVLTLREFRLFPEVLVPFTAVYLPWLEFFLGLFLLTGLMVRASSLLLACLNMIFTLAILSLLARGIEVDCGCFGLLADMLRLPDMADMKAVVRNLVFLAANVYLFVVKDTVLSVENYLKRTPRA